ncbi:fibronectin type III domain-containing protein [Mangrovimonas aestuarii]|uniref:fibronectin type III domain-containing protein n=1 Tax=Mangrovimonas aestuarii TaxID=3018443 RepID=UPI002378AAB7|nr:fibronectin type III domain-containing protein [Mangrovimonas aestuarii]
MMRKITFLFCLAFLSMVWQLSAQVTIGTGTNEQQHLPIEPWYGYTYSQSIYTTGEINASGTITGLQWYYSGTSDLADNQQLVIYMAESTKTEFTSNTDWEPITSFTEVYSGGITVVAGTPGWVALTFDTPFAYSGTDNLIIAVEENMPAYDSSTDDFHCSAVSSNRSIVYYSDGTNPDPAAPPTANGGSPVAFIPNVILDGITQVCPGPTDITFSNVLPNSADASWTAGGAETTWNIEYGPAGFALGTGTQQNGLTATSASMTGLTAATDYEFYVQADCGTETSSYQGPFMFTTECDIFTAPFTEPFAGSATPNCWTEGGDTAWDYNLNAGYAAIDVDDHTFGGGTNYAWMDGSDNGTGEISTLTSPLVDVSGLTSPSLQFALFSNNTNDATINLIDVELYDGAAWNTVMNITNLLGAQWQDYFIDLSTYTITGPVQVRFTVTGGTGSTFYNDVLLDDVSFDEMPTCAQPFNLIASAVTDTTVDLSWTEAGTATSWNIELVTAGTAPTGTPTYTGVTNPYTVTGLTAVTDYEFYVQADCGAGDTSAWVGPISFTTECAAYIPEYLQDFATIIPQCWDEADNGDPTTGPTGLGAGSWGPDGFANNGFSGAYKINLYLASKSDWVLSPSFDLSTGGPYQVEFDFAIMQFGSSTTAGTLGSDDEVQFLISTDAGTTWTALDTWDNTSVVPAGGTHYVYDLTSYAGMTVSFAYWGSEGTVNDPEDIDVSFDNFWIRDIPSCPEPSALTATSLSLTSTELSWTENGTSTSWDVEVVLAGTTPTGTPTAAGVTNPYTATGLTSDTAYEYYVRADCGSGDLSTWVGPFPFYTGYCESVPTSNDGQGVTNVTLMQTPFPSFGDVTYENHTDTSVLVFQGLDTNLQISFATGYTYGTNVWIDFNDDLVFDSATELVYSGTSTNQNPTTLDATFLMPATAAVGEHRMRIGTADSGQATPNPCYNGSWGVTLDFTVNIQVLNCVLPEATYTVVDDCDNGDQFLIDVDITSLGDATSLTVSDNQASTPIVVSATGVVQMGPYPFLTEIQVSVSNEAEDYCTIYSPNFELLACPPANDGCDGAIVVDVNTSPTCDLITSATMVAATPSPVMPSCGPAGSADVWFEFVALSESETITLMNMQGGTFNLDHAVYSGACGNLTELYCSDDDFSYTPLLTVGETYYLQVFTPGVSDETTTFDVCIKPAPDNITCETAGYFCNGEGGLISANITGLPDSTDVACLGSIPNPSYNILDIAESGTIEIQITQNTEFDENGDPVGNGLDVDFVLWGPFTPDEDYCDYDLFVDCPTCPNNTFNPGFYPFGNIVDCSYSAAPVENLTIPNAQEGEIYLLLVTNFNGGNGFIQIEQTNAPDADSGTLTADMNASFENVAVDPVTEEPLPLDLCGYTEYTLTVDTNGRGDYFDWYPGGFIDESNTTDTYIATESGLYTVIAYDEDCAVEATLSVQVNFYQQANPVQPDPLTACDNDGDGIVDFDLTSIEAQMLANEADPTIYAVTYHLVLAEAQQGINAIADPTAYASAGETIYVRVEDINAVGSNSGCFSTTSLELIVNTAVVLGTPSDLENCSDSSGTTSFDLTSNEADILNGQTGLTVGYYTSQTDADNGTNPIADPTDYDSSNGSETIYVRVEDTVTGCYAITSFNVTAGVQPEMTFDPDGDYELCAGGSDSTDLVIIPVNFTEADVTSGAVNIDWYFEGVAIPNENSLSLSVSETGDYEVVATFTNTGCTGQVGPQEVVEITNCVIPQVITPNGDAYNERFDLRGFNVQSLKIYNRNGTLVYSKEGGYTDEWYGQSDGGDELPVGTYFYVMVDQDNETTTAWVYIEREN